MPARQATHSSYATTSAGNRANVEARRRGVRAICVGLRRPVEPIIGIPQRLDAAGVLSVLEEDARILWEATGERQAQLLKTAQAAADPTRKALWHDGPGTRPRS